MQQTDVDCPIFRWHISIEVAIQSINILSLKASLLKAAHFPCNKNRPIIMHDFYIDLASFHVTKKLKALNNAAIDNIPNNH